MSACVHLGAQSCPTLCDPLACSPQGSSVPGDSPGKNTGVGCHALLLGIFPTQGLNPHLPHWRQITYQLSYLSNMKYETAEKVTEEIKEIIEENHTGLKAPVLSEENPGRSKQEEGSKCLPLN